MVAGDASRGEEFFLAAEAPPGEPDHAAATAAARAAAKKRANKLGLGAVAERAEFLFFVVAAVGLGFIRWHRRMCPELN